MGVAQTVGVRHGVIDKIRSVVKGHHNHIGIERIVCCVLLFYWNCENKLICASYDEI
jgi:hypothetical protein